MKNKISYLNQACLIALLAVALTEATGAGSPLIIDHSNVDIASLSSNQINRAKHVLHIGYGHTSHGSQITDGMSGLVDFANGGGMGLSLPHDIFEWNNGGSGGALDLEEGAGYGSGWLELDGGYWPDWTNETREYLDDPSHADVNVIMWSWCGQMDDKYGSGTLTNEYLLPMAQLEADYPNVVFVYMTGHVPGDGEMGATVDRRTKEACNAIRQWCIDGGRVLYDFNDIEHYSPDGTFFEFVEDDCDYFTITGSAVAGNWATEWQDSHSEGVDWYHCGSAHSQPLNANQKAYAAWALWCALAGDLDRDGIGDEWEERYGGCGLFGEGNGDYDGDGALDTEEFCADTNPTNSTSFHYITHSLAAENILSLEFESSPDRIYGLECNTNPVEGEWFWVEGQTNMPGVGGTMSLTGAVTSANAFFRVWVSHP